MKHYLNLTKFGIVSFVLVTGAGGYFLGVPLADNFHPLALLLLLTGLYFLSSGSFALNQYQERHLDALMPRTQNRPLPSGIYKPATVLALAIFMTSLGAILCFLVSWKVGVLGLSTVFLYNVAYTIYWKPKTPFAAVPGAIPGAMPIALGYTAGSGVIFNLENIYFFLVMFLWQMPHFWALALKYKADYDKASFPVLPLVIGDRSTQYYMGIYTFAYLALALGAPFFVPVGWLYLFIAMPFAFKVLWEFYRFVEDPEQKRWIHFFLWTTFSILIFVLVPAMDRWMPWIL